jgi:hypothetical protein
MARFDVATWDAQGTGSKESHRNTCLDDSSRTFSDA